MTINQSKDKINPPTSTKIKKEKKKSYKSIMKSIIKSKTTNEERKKQKEKITLISAKFSKINKI